MLRKACGSTQRDRTPREKIALLEQYDPYLTLLAVIIQLVRVEAGLANSHDGSPTAVAGEFPLVMTAPSPTTKPPRAAMSKERATRVASHQSSTKKRFREAFRPSEFQKQNQWQPHHLQIPKNSIRTLRRHPAPRPRLAVSVTSPYPGGTTAAYSPAATAICASRASRRGSASSAPTSMLRVPTAVRK